MKPCKLTPVKTISVKPPKLTPVKIVTMKPPKLIPMQLITVKPLKLITPVYVNPGEINCNETCYVGLSKNVDPSEKNYCETCQVDYLTKLTFLKTRTVKPVKLITCLC